MERAASFSNPFNRTQNGLRHTPTLDDWADPHACVVTKVRSVRSVAMGGANTYHFGGFDVPDCYGFQELTGARHGPRSTRLLIGFTGHPYVYAGLRNGFMLSDCEALGTLLLPASMFSTYLHIAHGGGAHMRIGGDGARNALGTDPMLLQA